MATKDHSLNFGIEKHQKVVNNDSNYQFKSLNLNQDHQNVSNTFSKSPKNVKAEKGKFLNYDFANNGEARKGCNLWKKSTKPFYNENEEALSLHIKAYENSVNDLSVSFDGEKNSVTKEKKITKQNLVDLISVIKNPFEFPRQQENDQMKEAETAYFKANQLLINPNLVQRNQTSSRVAPALTAISKPSEIDSKDAIPDESDQRVDVKLAFEFSNVPRNHLSAFENMANEGALELLKILSKEPPKSVKCLTKGYRDNSSSPNSAKTSYPRLPTIEEAPGNEEIPDSLNGDENEKAKKPIPLKREKPVPLKRGMRGNESMLNESHLSEIPIKKEDAAALVSKMHIAGVQSPGYKLSHHKILDPLKHSPAEISMLKRHENLKRVLAAPRVMPQPEAGEKAELSKDDKLEIPTERQQIPEHNKAVLPTHEKKGEYQKSSTFDQIHHLTEYFFL